MALPGRTTQAKVAAIIEVDSIGVPDLSPFIDTANEFVTELCLASGYTTTRLELIERWLAAHFYAIRDQRTSQESVGNTQASYQFKVDLGFNQTIYGQQAMRLDTGGNIARIEAIQNSSGGGSSVPPTNKAKVGALWLGTDPSTTPDTGP